LATGGPKRNNAKLGQNGSIRGHVTYFSKFWAPSISRERLKLETSNMAHRLATGGPNEKNAKLGQKGPEVVTWPTFRILGPPRYIGNGWS